MDEQAQTIIDIRNIHKTFRLTHDSGRSIKSIFTGGASRVPKLELYKALRGIDFEVKEGEFFGIVGRNGSGKSTLLKIIAGIYQPTKGSITTTGRLVPFIELGVGFNPDLTGKENVYLNAALLNFSEKEVDAMYDEIVQFAELERFMDQKLRNYSSGMQVRLAFAMAIRARADILLVDEVLAVGDADFQRKCFEYFKKLKRDKQTVVFVSHDMDAVREYCDRALLINDGKIACIGDSEEVAKEYTKLFLKQDEDMIDVSGKRWGNGHAQIIKPKAVVNENEIVIYHRVTNAAIVKSPMAGIRVKSLSGDIIMGTNTKIKKIHLDEKKDAEYSIAWTIPNILSDGKFEIDIAITEDSGLTICDWWESALSIRVKKAEKVPYNINPNIEVKKNV